ncbi:tRNA preQ1(34) S-adenosylmethionine ribosyltransferase-isomerase QueA [Sorangium cellulosum]|uniref:S-adenosylmethionine:tRNA ribosyltransferase-isomerase n=1 Tax=Sorangium cellulosum So0157-2 TaxID=1254432 RepID=S4XQV6_SORCE|nr:tRNA preQ1(34) S-adenosylmethionine ribosyltransferase-isomerase QueA [Sorangium cellulosum]AGP34894.1 S-adenosylmethionine tRNA ribosyltransferase [Sorangium cellulosum So0157-2]
MRCELLDYELPEALIASRPPEERDGARLLLVDRGREAGEVEHAAIRDLDRYIERGALVVVNDTKVVPARLFGKKRGTGGQVELFLLHRLDEAPDGEEGTAGQPRDGAARPERWRAMGRASKPIRPGAWLDLERDGALVAEVLERADDGVLTVRLSSPAGLSVAAAIDAYGHVPLPPYLGRGDDASDRERYQTIFARVPGAVAAPTAGLHLSPGLVERLRANGVEIASVTLHVGLGTFQPVTVDDLDQHPMHAEVYSVPEATAGAVAATRERGAPVVAIGTTVVRALESAADPAREGLVRAQSGETRLLIQPGYRFRVVDGLLTNFHLPRSTLLALVFAFAGRERALLAYRAAIEARYRFYSYGDAMLIRGASAP